LPAEYNSQPVRRPRQIAAQFGRHPLVLHRSRKTHAFLQWMPRGPTFEYQIKDVVLTTRGCRRWPTPGLWVT